MRYVAILNSGRAWVEGKTVSEQDPEIMRAHLVAMRRHYDEGAVLFGGPFRSMDGGLVLIEAPSRMDARAIIDQDPAVAAGILDYNLFEIRPFFDIISGEAWSQK